MSESQFVDLPFASSVFHPSDFSEASMNAFAHALALALIRQTQFTILHAGRDFLGEDEWAKFPPVRKTLERWGLLEPGSPRSAVFEQLKVRVRKVNLRSRSPLAASLDYLEEHPTDVIVLATEGREGLPSLFRPSTAEQLARRSKTSTLFVPNAARGFVSLEDGSITFRRVLVTVDRRPDPTPPIVYATRGATAFGCGDRVEILVLHVGDESEMPRISVPASDSYSVERLQRSGEVVEEIIRVAEEHEVDLIAMATQGRDGILDALRGTVTEQVLRRSPCPLLAVPSG